MFHLFCGQNYYPNGGLGDYAGRYATVEEALVRLSSLIHDWWHIAQVDDAGYLVIVKSSPNT